MGQRNIVADVFSAVGAKDPRLIFVQRGQQTVPEQGVEGWRSATPAEGAHGALHRAEERRSCGRLAPSLILIGASSSSSLGCNPPAQAAKRW